jgi:hypothetical protein
VALLLLQKGVGSNAAIRAAKLALVWGSATCLVKLVVYTSPSEAVSFSVELLWQVAVYSPIPPS